jgi:hypothetical protein
MKPGQTVYFFSKDGHPSSGKISTKITKIVENEDGESRSVLFSVLGQGGMYLEGMLYGSKEELLELIRSNLNA